MCSNNVSYTASTPPQSAKIFHKNENQSQLTADYNRRFLFVLSRSKITLIIAVVDSYQRVHSTEYLTRPVHWRLQSIQTNIHSIHLLNWYKQYTHIWKNNLMNQQLTSGNQSFLPVTCWCTICVNLYIQHHIAFARLSIFIAMQKDG